MKDNITIFRPTSVRDYTNPVLFVITPTVGNIVSKYISQIIQSHREEGYVELNLSPKMFKQYVIDVHYDVLQKDPVGAELSIDDCIMDGVLMSKDISTTVIVREREDTDISIKEAFMPLLN